MARKPVNDKTRYAADLCAVVSAWELTERPSASRTLEAVLVPYLQVGTRNSAITDKPRDAFRGQLRSLNMVPFDMLGVVSY